MVRLLAEAFENSGREMLASLQSGDFREGLPDFLVKGAAPFNGR